MTGTCDERHVTCDSWLTCNRHDWHNTWTCDMNTINMIDNRNVTNTWPMWPTSETHVTGEVSDTWHVTCDKCVKITYMYLTCYCKTWPTVKQVTDTWYVINIWPTRLRHVTDATDMIDTWLTSLMWLAHNWHMLNMRPICNTQTINTWSHWSQMINTWHTTKAWLKRVWHVTNTTGR